MADIEFHSITERLLALELRLDQIQRQADTLQLVLGWLLERQPDDAGLRFLARQVNEFETQPGWSEEVLTLDELREQIAQLRAFVGPR